MPTDTDYTILLTVTTTSTLESSSLRGGHKTVITIPNVTTATLTVAPSSQTPKLSTTSDTEDEASLTHKLQMTTKSSSNSRASVTTHHSLASTIGLSGNSKASNSLRDDNLLKLGLSVGLPIAIISLFVVGILGWYYITRRNARKGLTLHQRDGEFITFNGSELKREDSETTRVHDENVSKRKSVRAVFDRVGRSIRDSALFPINGRSDKLAGVSPFILRRFNLKTELEKPLPKVPSAQDSLPDMEQAVPKLDPKTVTSTARLVQRPYNKKLFDELTIEVGDVVRLIKEHTDGWSFVQMVMPVNSRSGGTNKEGMVPTMCLKALH
ncbi:hypothetical protein QFC19_007193 [Naganishia cerealis]|uniref:Uncharacterized protein n=1 Tax=Naganishia cerealis TaxID=610337 RepID=A0ACC2VC26_9TREE|nr:hypothetical protein QFC19_007193 [Naganishia cerealis]